MSPSDIPDPPARADGEVRDVASQGQSDASLATVSRQWSMVREINRQILHARSEQELFTSACRIAVDIGGLRLVWVGLVSCEGTRIEPVARWGEDASCLDHIRVDVAETEFGRGPVATAVREGRRYVANDLGKLAVQTSWHLPALARGHRSVGAFPLRRGGRVVGALSASSGLTNAFDDEQVDILDRLADDLGYVLDVLDGDDQRRAAEAALRASEERYRAVFEQAFEGIFTVAPSHAIVDANESAARMLGYTIDELRRMRAEDVIHPEEFARVPIRFGTIPPGGVILSERRFVKRDGSILEGELSTKSLLDGNFQVVVRDVSARKQVQAQLLLSDRMSALGRLASGVAHEINNPLAYVMLNLEMLGDRIRRLAPQVDERTVAQLLRGLDDAHDGAERMRRIVRTLSTFGRGDEDRVGPVDVNGVLDSAVEMAAVQLRHRARIVRRYGAVSPVRANSFRLGQVFLNLLINAADALADTGADNEIALSTSAREDGAVVVLVHDNGAGIPLALQSRIFDPFFTTKPVGKGTGLGLAVCHAIIASFDGQISCESAPDRGTTFRVVLLPAPAHAAPADRENRGRAKAELATAASPIRGRVLIADDDARVAKALAAALSAHDVVVVDGGQAALEQCRAERFDCILCDVMMPSVSGIAVHEALRRDGHGVERRMVFVTGGAVTEASRTGLARVDNQILEKPVDAMQLRQVVAAMVASSLASKGGAS